MLIIKNPKEFLKILTSTVEPRPMDTRLKGHCHGHFLTFLVKRHQNIRLSTFNHAGNAPRTQREGYLANCLKKRVTVNSFHQFFQTTSTKLEKVRLTFSS